MHQIGLMEQLYRRRALRTQEAAPGLLYTCPEDFVLKHGEWYEGEWTGRWRQGPPKQCYGWAIAMAAVHGLRYIEGYALTPTTREAFPHAWNLDAEGRLVDGTWCNQGLAYLGVEFSAERADDAIWNGDACVLDDQHRGHPLLQQPWTGEDYSLQWPPSVRLEMLRAGDSKAGWRWLAEQKFGTGRNNGQT